jgi:hypothetical protein
MNGPLLPGYAMDLLGEKFLSDTTLSMMSTMNRLWRPFSLWEFLIDDGALADERVVSPYLLDMI